MFEELNATLPTDPVLALYLPMHSTMVSSDVSGYGICVVLSQQQPSGEWKPVSYVSRSRSATDVNMLRLRRKALVTTWACERFSNYLTGKRFVVKTDRQPLVPLISSTAVDNMLPRVLQFRLGLTLFDISISHLPGKQLVIPDALSHSPGLQSSCASAVSFIGEVEEFASATVDSMPASDARLAEI